MNLCFYYFYKSFKMKYNFILLFACCLAANAVDAQQQLKGIIKDATTQQPLAGATVYINNLKKGSSTDSKGFYSITNLKKGNYLLEITNVGYKTIAREISLDKDTELNFSM